MAALPLCVIAGALGSLRLRGYCELLHKRLQGSGSKQQVKRTRCSMQRDSHHMGGNRHTLQKYPTMHSARLTPSVAFGVHFPAGKEGWSFLISSFTLQAPVRGAR